MTASATPENYTTLTDVTWGFVFRTWAAIMVALYAAFWLQLDNAWSAAVAAAGVAMFAALRPLLHLVGFNRAFRNPAVAELSLYVLILALLIVLF
jgi:uncharacterized membrane protein YccC